MLSIQCLNPTQTSLQRPSLRKGNNSLLIYTLAVAVGVIFWTLTLYYG